MFELIVAALLGFVAWLVQRAITARGAKHADARDALNAVEKSVGDLSGDLRMMTQQNSSDHDAVRGLVTGVVADIKDLREDVVTVREDVAEIKGVQSAIQRENHALPVFEVG